MATTYQVGEQCYDSASAAASAYSSSLPPVLISTSPACSYIGTPAATPGPAPQIAYTWVSTTGSACPALSATRYSYSAKPCGLVDPWNLSLEEGALIAGAVAAVWVTAWCFKALRLTLSSDGTNEREIS